MIAKFLDNELYMKNLKVKTVISELADNEEFRDIEGYEGEYQISSYGRVYSVKSGKFLKVGKNKKGYLQIWLRKNGKKKTYSIHRLVAQAFIPNPLHLPQVNHKSEVKTENFVSNLEWCDNKYNVNYGTRTVRQLQHPNWKAAHKKIVEKLSKPVLQFTKQGEFVAEFPSVKEASRQTKINDCSIGQCCNGRNYKSAGGFVWRFKEEVA